jgi:SnoaL-like protein
MPLDPTGGADAIAALSRAVLLEVFDERDPDRRAEAINRIFAQDVHFVDHNGKHDGRSEIGAAVDRLHARFPGFRFAPTSAPQLLEGAARTTWKFGPATDPAKITGADTILVRDGRVSVLLVFLDHAPAGSGK